jgi:hypothetical protein
MGDDVAMPPKPSIPRDLRLLPFRGSVAVSAGTITWSRLRGHAWRRLLPDVYITADVDLDHRLWCDAALIYVRGVNPGSVRSVAISGLSALYLMGIDHLTRDAPVEVTVPPEVRLSAVASRLRLVRAELSRAEVTEFGRLPTTSPLRTAVDLARRLDRSNAVAALDALTHRRIVKIDDVRRHAASLPGVPWRRRAFGVFDLVEPLTESPMETWLRLVLTDAGLPRPQAQYAVHDSRGRFVGRLDLAYREAKIGIEYEGDHHRERAQFRADIARLNALRAAGWTIIRVTADDVRHPEQIVRQIRALLEASTE